MSGKNGKEVGRVSLRVLPNMDDFKREAERDINKSKGVEVKVRPKLDNAFKRELSELSDDSAITPKLDLAKARAEFKKFLSQAKLNRNIDLSSSVSIDPQLFKEFDTQLNKLKRSKKTLIEVGVVGERSDVWGRFLASTLKGAETAGKALSEAIDKELNRNPVRSWDVQGFREQVAAEAARKRALEEEASQISRVTKLTKKLGEVRKAAQDRIRQGKKNELPIYLTVATDRLDKQVRAEVKKLRKDRSVRKLMRTSKAGWVNATPNLNPGHFGLLQIEAATKRLDRMEKGTAEYSKAVERVYQQIRTLYNRSGKGTNPLTTFVGEADWYAKQISRFEKNSARLNRIKTKMAATALATQLKMDSDKPGFLGRAAKTVNFSKTQLPKFAGAVKNTAKKVNTEVAGMSSKFKDLGQQMKKTLSNRVSKRSSGSGGRKILGLTRIGWITAAVSSLAAPAISIVSGALSTLPALGLAAGAALGAVALGFDGVKNAAKAMNPAIEKAQGALSAVMQEGMTPEFEKLGGALEQTIPGLEKVGKGTVAMFRGFTDAVSSKDGIQTLNKLLDNTAGLFTKMEPGVKDMTSGLLVMAEAGSRAFGELGGSFSSGMQKFRIEVQKLADSGALTRAFSSTTQMLGSFSTNVGRIIRGGINELPRMTESVNAFFDGIGRGVEKMMPSFTSLSNFVLGRLGTLADNIGVVFETIGPKLESIFSGLTPGFDSLINGLGDSLSPILDNVGSFLSGLTPGASEILSGIGTSLSELGNTLAAHPELGQNLQSLGAAIGNLFSTLSGTNTGNGLFGGKPLVTESDIEALSKAAALITRFVNDINASVTAFTGGDIGKKISHQLRSLGNELTFNSGWFDNAEQNFREELFSARNNIESSVSEYAASIRGVMERAQTDLSIDLSPQIKELDAAKTRADVDRVMQSVADILNEVSQGNPVPTKINVEPTAEVAPTTDLTASMQSAVEPAKQSLSEAFNGLGADLGATVDTELQSAMAQTDAAIANAATGIGASLGNALGGVEIPIEGLSANITASLDGLASSISAKIAEISNSASAEMANMVTSLATSLGGISAEVTTSLSGVSTGVQTAFSGIPEVVSSSLAGVPATMAAVFTDASAQANAAINAGLATAEGTLGGFGGRAQAAMGNMSGVLYASGQALVQGFINGINSKSGELEAAASNLASKARAYFPFSPAKKGPFSGRGYTTYSGKALATGFAEGITSGSGAVTSATSGMLSDVQSQFLSASAGVSAAFADFDGEMARINRERLEAPVKLANAKKIQRAVDSYDKRMEEFKKKQAESKNPEKLKEPVLELPELEEPDYTKMDRSFQAYYIDSVKEYLNSSFVDAVRDFGVASQLQAAINDGLARFRAQAGNHPILDQIEAGVNDPKFGDRITKALEEAKIGEIPVNFAIANLEQLKSDLGMSGNSVASNLIDAALSFDPNQSDSNKERWAEEKGDKAPAVHYHVLSVDEALKLEDLRQRKAMMKID